ncbi:MAG: hypothetical protein LBH29_01885 [Elusimicrobiota bacterium]|jgi:DNA-directed RNA polymerase specialized sigma24 family protein|nr:hypothetical protein [Elusimicrobiota bacterium]
MNLIERFQDELYSLALSLTYDAEISKKAALDAFEKTLPASSGDFSRIKAELFKNMLSELGFFDIKKNNSQAADIVSLIKKSLPLFDKKTFVLKYEFNVSVADISYILGVPDIKVKKSLLASVRKVMRKMKEDKDDLR